MSSKSYNGSSQNLLYESCTEDTAWKRHASSFRGPTDGGLWISTLMVRKSACNSLARLLTLPDLSSLVKKELREQDPNASRWYDGDIIRQIRLSTLADDSSGREKWLARLATNSKRRCLQRLEALPGTFLESWDDLIPFAGLWPSVKLGTFPRLAKLHCPEV